MALLSALPLSALAVKYSDLDGHWAESYINELSDLGYLTGYTDGTVRPDKTITACEAIALLSRFYSVDSSVADWVHEDYGEFVKTYIDPSLSWAYDEIELSLAAGILSEKELLSLRLTAPIEKELLSVLLVRALQLTDDAAKLVENGVELTFADTSDITETYRGHIAVLVQNGIIEGNSKNQFTPNAEVTRGVVAAMVVRGLDYVKKLGHELVLNGYGTYTQHSGIVTAVKSTEITFRDDTGIRRSYPLASDASVTDNGTAVTLSEKYVGCHVTVRVMEQAATSVTLRNEEGVSWVQGKLTECTKTSGGYTLYIASLEDGSVSRVLAATSASVTINGAEKALSDLKAGMYLVATLNGSAVSDVAAVSGSYTLKGTISSLVYGAPVVLSLTSDDGGSILFELDLTDLPTIKRGENEVSIERLSLGDEVTMTIENCELTMISAVASENTLDGILTSIVSTTGGTTWMITDAQNETHSLTVDASANAYQNGKAILLSTIQVGDTLSVTVDGKTITEIHLKSSNSNTANKVSGIVLVVDTSAKQITVLNSSNRLIYISTASVGSIIKSSTGKTVSLSSVEPNSQLLAYGSYADASNFTATSIIIED